MMPQSTQHRPSKAALAGKRSTKDQIAKEQKGVVASSSQLGTVCASALPRSNQIEATLFD
jgi:hypothetical protein